MIFIVLSLTSCPATFCPVPWVQSVPTMSCPNPLDNSNCFLLQNYFCLPLAYSLLVVCLIHSKSEQGDEIHTFIPHLGHVADNLKMFI